MTDTDKNRLVATALGLWKEGCKLRSILEGPARPKNWCDEHKRYEHPDPPPDFLSPAGADLLLRTLLEKGHVILLDPQMHELVLDRFNAQCVNLDDPNSWHEALLDAAYRLLKTDDRKTMEGM